MTDEEIMALRKKWGEDYSQELADAYRPRAIANLEKNPDSVLGHLYKHADNPYRKETAIGLAAWSLYTADKWEDDLVSALAGLYKEQDDE
jgi:hypothetical protein